MAGTSTISSGAATGAPTCWTIWFCSIPTAIGKFTVRDWWWKSPRPARGVCEGLSRMRGNLHVRFLGERAAVTPLSYPTGAEGTMRKYVNLFAVILVGVSGCGPSVPKERIVGNGQSGTVSRDG